MRRCHLKGQTGDALNVVLAAAGYNLRWLMRWLVLSWADFRALLGWISGFRTTAAVRTWQPPLAALA